jgi:hypothetical protein
MKHPGIIKCDTTPLSHCLELKLHIFLAKVCSIITFRRPNIGNVTLLNFAISLSLLFAVLLGLLIAIFGIPLSKWNQLAVRNDPEPERAMPLTVYRKTTLEDEPKVEERQTMGSLPFASIQPVRREARENVVGGSSAPAHANDGGDRPTCFRITGVPSFWDKNKLEEKLAEIDPDLDFKHVKLSIFRACSYFTKNKTA